eukprot:TRINITY_DN5086_c0_g1_i1.p1 TRINITY_DN5086_c0_g1~~TRINITY_DN5086_c0_g1_i1.p1  ORF type:complete len:442 (+),score=100.94 TRINITY_DN5086_c0_g1_i1:176-1501(+)
MAATVQHNASGVIPCGNCFAIVPQDEYWAKESFGKYAGAMEPGLNVAGFDCCGACITFQRVSNRIHELHLDTPTKTLDNVFVVAHVVVQLSVASPESMYKLTDVKGQVDSYASDMIRSTIPTKDIDHCFADKEAIAMQVQDRLSQAMEAFGFNIHKVLVTDFTIAPDVMRSMNEVNKQKRLKEAAEMAAEAAKVRTVAIAEAHADAKALAGQGIARQRAALINGLQKSIGGGGGGGQDGDPSSGDPGERPLSHDELTTLMLVTQYFDTLKNIGSRPNSQMYFLSQAQMDPNNEEGQQQLGLLQAEAAIRSGALQSAAPMQNVRAARREAPAGPPQQQMHQPPRRFSPAPSPVPSSSPMRRASSFASSGGDASPFGAQTAPARPPAQLPTTGPQVQQLHVQVPPGCSGGEVIQVQVPSGHTLQIRLPANVQPGMTLKLDVRV